MNNTNNALETLVQRDKQIKKTNDKLKASINKLDAELETTTNALSTHASNTEIHTSKEELIQLIVDHLESLDLGITKEVVSVLPTEDISDNTLYFVPNDKGSHNEYLYINDKWELVGSTETNFTDYYTKQETDTLLESKANSVHSHVVSDITDFPTIPTKVSDLTNDSGYITGVAWGDVTNKPVLSQVAISGSYTDLSNTPAIPTKVSQLENDMGFGTGGDTSDCVHKTGNETINGIKTFTSGPWVTNNATTNGYSIKLNAIARNEVPTKLYHATFRAYDKNDKILGEYCVEKSTTGSSLLNMNVRSEDSNGKQLSESVILNMSNDGSVVRFYPSSNNKVDLGMPNNKWGNAYIANTYTNRVTTYSIAHHTDDNYFFVSGGSDYDKGAALYLGGISAKNFTPGRFVLVARKTGAAVELTGSPDGTLTWGGKNIALDENLVHRSGNETIGGTKTFSSKIVGNLQGNADTATSANSVAWSNVTGKPTIPTKTSDLTNDSGYITSVSWEYVTSKPNFSKVATSGSYNDLSNKPTIPNVYNKTLTIQKNGTNVATFTSNSNTDVTADITVPTKVSELSNDSGFITSEINSSGVGWVRFKNGLQICYGYVNNTNNLGTGITRVSLPKAFNVKPNLIITPDISARYVVTASVEDTASWVLNTFGAYNSPINYVTDALGVNYIAVGLWK